MPNKPLHVVASTVRIGSMEILAFGSADGDFWDIVMEEEEEEPEPESEDSLPVEQRQQPPRLLVGWRLVQRLAGAVRRGVGSISSFVYTIVVRKPQQWLLVGRPQRRRKSAALPDKVSSRTEKTQVLSSPISAGKKRRTSWFRGRFHLFGKRQSETLEKNTTRQWIRKATACVDDDVDDDRMDGSSSSSSSRKGLFACLEASMLVPGAAGNPIKLLCSKYRQEEEDDEQQQQQQGKKRRVVGQKKKKSQKKMMESLVNTCFDAFCSFLLFAGIERVASLGEQSNVHLWKHFQLTHRLTRLEKCVV